MKRLAILLFAFCAFYEAFSLFLQFTDAIPAPRRLLHQPYVAWEESYFKPAAQAVRFHPRWQWELRPGACVGQVEINGDGYRGRIVNIKKGPLARIVILGDSLTLGAGHYEANTWPARLEKTLAERNRPAEIVNFAMPAFTAAQGLELYRGRARDYGADVLLVNFGRLREVDLAESDLSDVDFQKTINKPSYRLQMFSERFGPLRYLSQKIDVPKTPESLSNPAARNRRIRLKADEFGAAMTALAKEGREAGSTVIFIKTPRLEKYEAATPWILQYDGELARVASELNVNVIDVHGAIRARERELRGALPPQGRNALFDDEEYLTALGQNLFAETVAAELAKMNVDKR